jgi:23S rRNA (adenine2030-N6)-methyltransferase
MLAYRHAFHAGNHGDVLKHAVLVAVLRHMAQKDTPFTLVDTHAGAGGYALAGRYAQKNAEHAAGVSILEAQGDKLPPLLFDYMSFVRAFNGNAAITQYPGSPALASMLLRADDPLRLYELHPTDERILQSFIGRRMHTRVYLEDGFAHFTRELPPPSRRGVVLIDPSYELKADYAKTLAALREGLRLFATGTYVVWHPQLQSLDAMQLPKRLMTAAGAAPKGWLHASLTVGRRADDGHAEDFNAREREGFGMTGSGVLVVNPPFTLAAQLREALPVLATLLGHDGQGQFLLREGQGAAGA